MTEIKLRGNSSSILLSIGWILLAAGCQGSPAPAQTPRMPASTLKPGDVRTDAKGIEQVWVEAGTFRMGTDEESLRELENLNPPGFVAGEFAIEQPQHEVRITQGYWIDKFEVTNRAFRAFADGGGYAARAYWSDEGWAWREDQPAGMLPLYCMGTGPDHPAACATWYEAEAYARWRGGRLPTEAEWEYAARGPESRVFPWGDAFDPDLCNVTGGSSTKPAGSYPGGASWVGAQDMAGNGSRIGWGRMRRKRRRIRPAPPRAE
jgi:formylglycine-generating enzyme required for sulfatase activity